MGGWIEEVDLKYVEQDGCYIHLDSSSGSSLPDLGRWGFEEVDG